MRGHEYIPVDDVDDVDVFAFTIPERSDTQLAVELEDDYLDWEYPEDRLWIDYDYG